MLDFGPYLIFRLYLSRMQKYAFFSVCANIPGEILLPPTIFFITKYRQPRKQNTGNRGNKKQATEETKSRQLRKSQKKSSIFALAYLKDR